jgi:hypothetical protein
MEKQKAREGLTSPAELLRNNILFICVKLAFVSYMELNIRTLFLCSADLLQYGVVAVWAE